MQSLLMVNVSSACCVQFFGVDNLDTGSTEPLGGQSTTDDIMAAFDTPAPQPMTMQVDDVSFEVKSSSVMKLK